MRDHSPQQRDYRSSRRWESDEQERGDKRDRRKPRHPSRERHQSGRKESHRDRSRSPRKPPRSQRHHSQSPQERLRRHRSPSSPSDHHQPHRHPSHRHRSPSPSTDKPPQALRSKSALPSQSAAFNHEPSPPAKQQPNFAASGKLAAESNTAHGTDIVLKYHEPSDARLPPASASWRLFVFRGETTLETLVLGTRSCWLFGRERAVADCPTDHPSCSKQHAVLQFRHTVRVDELGEREAAVRLYVMDLESANGTVLNGERIPEGRFVECRSGDVLKFGESTREYVLLLPPKE